MAKLTWFLVILLFLVGCGSSTSKMSFDEYYDMQVLAWEKNYENLQQEDKDIDEIFKGLHGRYLVKQMPSYMVDLVLRARGSWGMFETMRTSEGTRLYEASCTKLEYRELGYEEERYHLWFYWPKDREFGMLTDWTVFYH